MRAIHLAPQQMTTEQQRRRAVIFHSVAESLPSAAASRSQPDFHWLAPLAHQAGNSHPLTADTKEFLRTFLLLC